MVSRRREQVRALRIRAGSLYQQGLVSAQNEMQASAWAAGVGGPEVEAAKWYRRAADQGYAPAQAGLGYLYAQGKGVVKDPVQALEWFRKSAAQGDPSGQANLGALYGPTGVALDEVGR